MKKSSLKAGIAAEADLQSASEISKAADYKSAVQDESDYKSDSAVPAANQPAAEMTLAERVMAPTPKFFKTLRTIGLVIGLVGGAILASPVALPAAIVTVGGYLALAGSIVTGVSQTAVEKE